MELYDALERDRKLMLAAVTEAKELGLALAEAEADYQKAKHETALTLKSEGMPATLIAQILKGDERVVRLLLARDCAQVVYDSAREAINSYKLSARLIEAQIQREWGAAGRGF